MKTRKFKKTNRSRLERKLDEVNYAMEHGNRYEDEAAYRVAGTGTFGVPQYLYSFAYDALSAAGYTSGDDDMAKKIKDMCDAGVFGEAWIQINVS